MDPTSDNINTIAKQMNAKRLGAGGIFCLNAEILSNLNQWRICFAFQFSKPHTFNTFSSLLLNHFQNFWIENTKCNIQVYIYIYKWWWWLPIGLAMKLTLNNTAWVVKNTLSWLSSNESSSVLSTNVYRSLFQNTRQSSLVWMTLPLSARNEKQLLLWLSILVSNCSFLLWWHFTFGCW